MISAEHQYHSNSHSHSHSNSRRKSLLMKVIELCVRLLVIPLNVASLLLTFTNRENNITYGNLHFRDLLALKYMICIAVLSCAYALFASLAISISRTSFLTKLAWLFLVSDQVIAYLTLTSTGAVGEMLYLAYNGDVQVTWSQACTTYPNFCTRMTTALILHSFTLSSLFLLPLLSAFRLFQQPPPPPQTVTTFSTTNPAYTVID